jgi:hypothetical protein
VGTSGHDDEEKMKQFLLRLVVTISKGMMMSLDSYYTVKYVNITMRQRLY